MTLIDRLSKLDGPSRRLDHEMHILFFVPDDKKNTVEWNHFGSYSWSPSPDHVMIDKVPAYTSSVDAAVALAEKVLPGWKWYAGNWNVHAAVLSPDRNNDQRAVAATPAIALCIAVLKGHATILRAKEASK